MLDLSGPSQRRPVDQVGLAATVSGSNQTYSPETSESFRLASTRERRQRRHQRVRARRVMTSPRGPSPTTGGKRSTVRARGSRCASPTVRRSRSGTASALARLFHGADGPLPQAQRTTPPRHAHRQRVTPPASKNLNQRTPVSSVWLRFDSLFGALRFARPPAESGQPGRGAVGRSQLIPKGRVALDRAPRKAQREFPGNGL
jgi:hypothetical protein